MSVYPPHELDPSTAVEFDRQLEGCDPTAETVVDFKDVAFCDSSGIRVLVTHVQRHHGAGGSIRVVNTNDTVRRVFEITGLIEIFGMSNGH